MLIKDEVLRFRLAGGERALLDAGAKRLGVSTSELVRDAGLAAARELRDAETTAAGNS